MGLLHEEFESHLTKYFFLANARVAEADGGGFRNLSSRARSHGGACTYPRHVRTGVVVMTKTQMLTRLKHEIHALMGSLSITEITRNHALIRQIETVLSELSKAA
jgi:hypothetical protein